MDRILKGIMKFRQTDRKTILKEFERVKVKPTPKAVFFTCMDSRMIPTRCTKMKVGDIFVVRNAGNLIPHSHYFLGEMTSNEPAALELGCVIHNLKHVIVCGHSDCKAMTLLYKLQESDMSSQENRRISPLRAWLCTHAQSSLEKFQQLELNDFAKPLVFLAESPSRKFVAYIDPDNKLDMIDKLSQINTLQQIQNIASYSFLQKRLERHQVCIHALWFHINTGEMYYFSRQAKQFIVVNECTIDTLLEEIASYE